MNEQALAMLKKKNADFGFGSISEYSLIREEANMEETSLECFKKQHKKETMRNYLLFFITIFALL
jgi:hypothetical protein